MLRKAMLTLLLVGLSACDQNGAGREAIANRCIAGGEAPEICRCFADESSSRLEGDLFQIVVLGAQGMETETDRLMKELPADRQADFSLAMREIVQACGAEGYLSDS
ncbi:MAG TPA: hypothetical protein VIA80_16975 [Hyphomonadaceae bacterium]|jgi:hypothetical protein